MDKSKFHITNIFLMFMGPHLKNHHVIRRGPYKSRCGCCHVVVCCRHFVVMSWPCPCHVVSSSCRRVGVVASLPSI